ncbi:MAG: hypothetical protein Ct9H300mP7_2440 [Verrucomicrobiota bacterium]|nr:MAG: hypothetical protein Ct9H300mP7_2440 [Verrucomicrobiota bacterium]
MPLAAGMLPPPVAFGMCGRTVAAAQFSAAGTHWQEALGEVKLLGLFNPWVFPFLHWHHRAPDELGFANAVWLLALCPYFT